MLSHSASLIKLQDTEHFLQRSRCKGYSSHVIASPQKAAPAFAKKLVLLYVYDMYNVAGRSHAGIFVHATCQISEDEYPDWTNKPSFPGHIYKPSEQDESNLGMRVRSTNSRPAVGLLQLDSNHTHTPPKHLRGAGQENYGHVWRAGREKI